jgi:hypothetical protein
MCFILSNGERDRKKGEILKVQLKYHRSFTAAVPMIGCCGHGKERLNSNKVGRYID